MKKELKLLTSFIQALTADVVREAAHLKAHGKMSFADTILVATANCVGATIVTCDHVELGPVEMEKQIPFLWIRPNPAQPPEQAQG